MREILQSEGISIVGGGIPEVIALGSITVMAFFIWNAFNNPYQASSTKCTSANAPCGTNYDYDTHLYFTYY